MSTPEYILADAILSPCGLHRYRLERAWDNSSLRRPCVFIMLNPSTADGLQDDPTIRRCVRFARSWGYNHLVVVNLFSYRATDPDELLKSPAPVEGPRNMEYIWDATVQAGLIVAAWGAQGCLFGQDRRVLDTITHDVRCLGTTKSGQPRHPLYVRGDTYPVRYTPCWRES
jgi:hypothetical protein